RNATGGMKNMEVVEIGREQQCAQILSRHDHRTQYEIDETEMKERLLSRRQPAKRGSTHGQIDNKGRGHGHKESGLTPKLAPTAVQAEESEPGVERHQHHAGFFRQ